MTHRRRRAWRSVALCAVLATAVVSGCTKPPPAKRPEHTSQAPQRTLTFQLEAQAYGKVSVRVPEAPVATAPTDAKDVTLELYALRRVGGAVQVVFALRHTGDDYSAGEVTYDMDEDPAIASHDASRVAIVDPAGLKEYKTFLSNGQDGDCLCTLTWDAVGDAGVSSGDRTYYLAEVAAPPAGVSTVTVRAGVAEIAGARIEG
jgi:hypothetical protein